MRCCYVSGKLARRLVALITMRALERLFPDVNPLVKVKLVLVFEAFLAESADVWLTFHMDQFVEPQ